MTKGIIVNNINDINYAQNNLAKHILVTRNPEIKRKYSKLDIKFYHESGNDEIEKYNSIFYLGMNWFRNEVGKDLLCNGGFSPPIIFTRRLSIALCEYYKIYNLLILYFDIFDTIACSINESLTFKNVAKYFTDKIEWYDSAEDACVGQYDSNTFHPENYNYLNLDGFPKIHPFSNIARCIQNPFMNLVRRRKHLYIQDYTSYKHMKIRKDTLLPNSLIPWKGYYQNLSKLHLSEAESIIPSTLDVDVVNHTQITLVLCRINIVWDQILISIFLDLINNIYQANRDKIIRCYAVYKELFLKYKPEVISIPGETFFGNITAALIAKSLGIKTILMLDGYQTAQDHNIYLDSGGGNYIFDKFIAFGNANKDLLCKSYNIHIEQCILAEPSIISLHKVKSTNISKQYDATILAYSQHSSPTYFYDPYKIVKDIVLLLCELGICNIAIKIKPGDKNMNHIKLNDYLYKGSDESITRETTIEYLTGKLSDHVLKSNCLIGQLSTATVEATFHNIPYYVYEPHCNGKNDWILKSSTITSIDSIARNIEQLKYMLLNKKQSINCSYDHLFKGPTLDNVNLF
jgi:hypothetical protein